MTNNLSSADNWKELYSAADTHWDDLFRIGQVVIPIVLLIFLATMYMVVVIAPPLIPEWGEKGISINWVYIRLMVLILAPTMVAVLGIIILFIVTARYVRMVYQLPDTMKLGRIIRLRLLGVPPLPPPLNGMINYPFLVLEEPVLEDNHWARIFGGPATLVIYDGIALYLEHGNQFSRVVGPGMPMPFLERHERIKEVIDLRPQVKTDVILPWTKDGIRIKLTIRAECQINASPQAKRKSKKFRYPFDPLAVKSVVEHLAVRVSSNDEPYQATWMEGAWGTVTGAISAFVAGHTIDELFFGIDLDADNLPDYEGRFEQILSKRFADEKLEDVNNALANNGIRTLNIQIRKIEFFPYEKSAERPDDKLDEVLDTRIKYWESTWKRIAALRSSRAEANRIRAREQAHAEAQRTLLMTIIQKLEQVDPDNMTESLMLSLSNIVDQGLDDPIVRPLIAKEAFSVLERVRRLLRERF